MCFSWVVCKGHRTEQSQSTTSTGQTDSNHAQRTLNQSDEREMLPCISPRPDSFIKTKQAERQSKERDVCPISYRSNGREDLDLPFKNSMFIIFFSYKASASFSSSFFMVSSKATFSFYLFFFPLVGSGNETDSDGSVPELEEPSGTLLRPSNPQVGCRFMSDLEWIK